MTRHGTAGPTVTVVLDHDSSSRVAVERAAELAEAMHGTLHVLLAISHDVVDDRPELVRAGVRGLLEGLPSHVPHELEVVRGTAAQRGIQIARIRCPVLIVVDSGYGASEACRMADELAIPVLVARQARPDGGVVAASDLRHPRYPVLSQASHLADALERDVMFFHNATLPAPFALDPLAGPASYTAALAHRDGVVASRRARLRDLATRPARRARACVARQPNTADAILDVARDRDPDVVVVGHRPRSWLQWLMRRGRITARVVARCRRSVLIVPLGQAPFAIGAGHRA